MKSNRILQFAMYALAAFAFAFITACEGPAGPPGPSGPAGANGADGQDGANGIDANETCKQCHNSNTEIVGAQQAQFAFSAHSGGTYYNRSGDCAGCHNNEGFRARSGYTDEWTEAQDFTGSLTQISCYTCHNTHETYTEADWGLSYATQVTGTYFGYFSTKYDQGALKDYSDNSNLCVQCHQGRDPSEDGEVPLLDDAGTVTITNKRWGPHHGPQGNVAESRLGIRVTFAGAESYPAEGNGHTNGLAGDISCVDCHMQQQTHALGFADSYGTKVWAGYAKCAECHTDEATAKTAHEALMTEVEGKITALKDLLVAQGVIGTDGYVTGLPNTITADQAKALWNYKLITEDQSLGVHAPTYVKALLDNSAALITP